MLGLTFDKVLVLGILAAFVIGPTRLPDAAAQLGRFVRMVRQQLEGAKESLRETGGPDLDEVDWKKLDPRQYDPRRIIREALSDNPASHPDFKKSQLPTEDDTSISTHPAVSNRPIDTPDASSPAPPAS